MSARKEIAREQAKQLIDEVEFGYLVVGEMERVPVIGEVDPADLEYEIAVESYVFGETEKAQE